MKEIEILVEVYDEIDKVKSIIEMLDFEYIGKINVIDEYYYDPKRKELKPDRNNQINHCLRLRQKNNKSYITYKDDIFEDKKWIYSDEYETEVESLNILKTIFDKLGLIKFIEIDNVKETYKNDKYEIVIENVKDLGIFMEVEYLNETDDIHKIKKEIQDFIDNLGINVSKELNIGKPELFLKRHNIRIKAL